MGNTTIPRGAAAQGAWEAIWMRRFEATCCFISQSEEKWPKSRGIKV